MCPQSTIQWTYSICSIAQIGYEYLSANEGEEKWVYDSDDYDWWYDSWQSGGYWFTSRMRIATTEYHNNRNWK